MQPYFFPYLGYYQLVASVDKFIVYDDVAFIKQGWISRNRILVGGKAHTFSVNLKSASSFRLIKDTELHDRLFPTWKTKFYRTIECAYRKAPYYAIAFRLIESVLEHDHKYVSKLAVESIKVVCKYLGIETEIVESSQKYNNQFIKGQERVIDICKTEGASLYINAPGGAKLCSKDRFSKEGISLKFLQPRMISYSQFANDFVPCLSIVDVLMFNSRESSRHLIRQCDLI
jgi:hypothetical protein